VRASLLPAMVFLMICCRKYGMTGLVGDWPVTCWLVLKPFKHSRGTLVLVLEGPRFANQALSTTLV
jgi:hypothetical protein